MRTPSDPHEKPLVIPQHVERPAPTQQPDHWRSTSTPGIQQNQDGKLRTDLPDPSKVVIQASERRAALLELNAEVDRLLDLWERL